MPGYEYTPQTRISEEQLPNALTQETRCHNARQLFSVELMMYRSRHGVPEGDTLDVDESIALTHDDERRLRLTCASDTTARLKVTAKDNAIEYWVNTEAGLLTAQALDVDDRPVDELVTLGTDVAAEQTALYLRDLVFALNNQ